MDIKTARIMREASHPDVSFAVVVPVVDSLGKWQLCFGPSTGSLTHTLDSKRGRRLFSKIDSACTTAKALGFERVEVYMP